MVHLRIVAPSHDAEHALDLLKATPSVCNLIYLQGAAHKPEGDVILCDVAREDASVVVSDLKEFGIDREGSIAMEDIDSLISDAADRAEQAARGLPADAVVWEEVEARTSENTELSASFLIFMVLACLIASVGIILDSPILIIGAMVVGPEFGPIAGFCVAVVQRRRELVKRSLLPLADRLPARDHRGLPVHALHPRGRADARGLLGLGAPAHPVHLPPRRLLVHRRRTSPGRRGVLSLTNAKSGALVGVLISVTTIPAAANIGVAAAYDGRRGVGRGDGAARASTWWRSAWPGSLTLFIQRKLYQRRRRAHLHDQAREAAGLPVGRSRHDKPPAKEGAGAGPL